MPPSIVVIAIFIYISLLFTIARWGDKQHFVEKSWSRHPIVYALALGVYCTSWTFYGLVGTASTVGWNFLPILLGPILLFTVGHPVLKRIFHVCRQEHIHSIADFIASRYGKRQGVAATVSLVVLLATIPYIALQLKAVSDTLVVVIGEKFLVNQDMTLIIAISMVVFALLFGAKRLDVSGYHAGLMSVIAFESIVKLFVLVLIACFAFVWFSGDIPDVDNQSVHRVLFTPPSQLRFLVETFLSMCAIFCLPRMFHVTFVECLSEKHLEKTRWVFASYLGVISVCVFVIAWMGNIAFFNNPSVSGDSYVIEIPLEKEQPWLALVGFLGGFSAATAMIIVATVTLSQMLSNDVILPLLVRGRKNTPSDFSRSLIVTRRITVIFVVIGAYIYQVALAENVALTSIGLIAFALVVQLAPAVLFGLYWRKGNVHGLYAGLTIGLLLWFYTLMIPLLAQSGLLSTTLIEKGLFDIPWLRPEHLFGLSFGDSFTRGVLLSLGANVAFYVWYSLTVNESLSDRIQATAFTQMQKSEFDPYTDIDIEDLFSLMKEFLGETNAEMLFFDYRKKLSNKSKRELIQQAQKLLAGTVGVASSQAMIEGLRTGKKMAVEEVVSLFGETTKALRFNKEVLFSSFENISSGISVVDQDLKLIAWNSRYESMFDYPEGLLQVGLHVSDIMRFNGERGMLGEGNIEDLIRKRLSLMATGNSYRVVRYHQDDVVIEIKGRPLPNGGYVTTYDDITEFILAQRKLEDVNINLEKRVQERTQTIEKINEDLLKEIKRRSLIEGELRQAKIIADQANESKTKFLSLAGHDVLQPLNAANLYVSALNYTDEHDRNLVRQLSSAIQNAEAIISSLLEVSRLDRSALQPHFENFSLNEMLVNLVNEAKVQKPQGLDVVYCPTSTAVRSDETFLRRIVQNFISNAMKYTGEGKVLIGCRRRYIDMERPAVEICVFDNGPGIAEQELSSIFNDFYRVNNHQRDKIPGVGLGLSVVMRFGELLHHPVQCQSTVGKGSCFSVIVPMATVNVVPEKSAVIEKQDDLQGIQAVYVDDDSQNLSAMEAIFNRWSCSMTGINSVAEAKRFIPSKATLPDILLMDFQLDDPSINGIQLANRLLARWQEHYDTEQTVPVCIVSAAMDDDLPGEVAQHGFEFLRKPIKPAKLRALLSQLNKRRSA